MTMRSYATPADPSIHSAPPERSRLSTCASNSQFLSKKMSNTTNRGDEGKAGKKMRTCRRMPSPRLHPFGTARDRASFVLTSSRARVHLSHPARTEPVSPPDTCLRNPRTARGRDAHVGTYPRPHGLSRPTRTTITAMLASEQEQKEARRRAAKILAEARAAEYGAFAYLVCGTRVYTFPTFFTLFTLITLIVEQTYNTCLGLWAVIMGITFCAQAYIHPQGSEANHNEGSGEEQQFGGNDEDESNDDENDNKDGGARNKALLVNASLYQTTTSYS
ncbi:hypothetical protein EI94DRAFT_1706434 [Lactarius quietus]|nr:hypothetical protein EI94DRAFT_1706434 [Lactarius quietus]